VLGSDGCSWLAPSSHPSRSLLYAIVYCCTQSGGSSEASHAARHCTARTTMGLLMHHIHTPPVPPSARSELSIPAALDQLVLSCLAKDPAERPHSAKELSQRLAEVDGAGAWTQERAQAWWVTHRPAGGASLDKVV